MRICFLGVLIAFTCRFSSHSHGGWTKRRTK